MVKWLKPIGSVEVIEVVRRDFELDVAWDLGENHFVSDSLQELGELIKCGSLLFLVVLP